jgi:hypothetical protein
MRSWKRKCGEERREFWESSQICNYGYVWGFIRAIILSKSQNGVKNLVKSDVVI